MCAGQPSRAQRRPVSARAPLAVLSSLRASMAAMEAQRLLSLSCNRKRHIAHRMALCRQLEAVPLADALNGQGRVMGWRRLRP